MIMFKAALSLFWLKILLKRMIVLFKLSPAVSVFGILLLAALVIRKSVLLNLNGEQAGIALMILCFVSSVISLRKVDILNATIFHAKCGHSIFFIRIILFTIQALKNNLFIFAFLLLALIKRIEFDFLYAVPIIFCTLIFSILCSLLIISAKNKAVTRSKPVYNRNQKIRLNPVIKSTIHDFFPSLSAVLIIIPLFFAAVMDFIKDAGAVVSGGNSGFIPVMLFAILSFGSCTIIEAAGHINWPFYRVVYSDFKYHFKRAFLSLLAVYSIPLICYIVIIGYIAIKSVPIFMFAILAFMAFSVSAAFLYGSVFKKSFYMLFCLGAAAYVCYFNPYFMLLSVLPLVLVYYKARTDDYFDWVHLW